MSGKCLIVPREQELMAGCPWGHPAALLGWLSPGDSRRIRAHRRAVGREGAENKTLLYIARSDCPCRGGTRSIPLPWHG